MIVQQSVSTVTVSDLSRSSYACFKHETTSYVSVPHGASSQVLVQWGGPCRVCINSNGQQLVCESAADGNASIGLSDLIAPLNRALIPALLRPLFIKHRPHQQRLYAFSVEIQSEAPDHRVLSSSDFHVLCPLDYELARALSLELASNPRAIGADLISDRAEGTRCPECNKVRKSL
jgi:hypothetical protein